MAVTVKRATNEEQLPGRCVGERSWPSPCIVATRYPLARHRILGSKNEEQKPSPELTVQSPLSLGEFGGKWCSYNAPPDMPYDQREEDGGAMLFDSDP